MHYVRLSSICIAAGLLLLQPSMAATPVSLKLCPGLTIVTAVSQSDGDYESIKTVTSVTDRAIGLHYSNERSVQDFLSNDPPKLVRTDIDRSILRDDLKSASLYLQLFSDQIPAEVPGTTAIGTSADVLNALRTSGQADLGIFIDFSGEAGIDRDEHPNVYDNQMVATISRVEPDPVMVPVIVDDLATSLPAIHAEGDYFGDKTEFYFLDDPDNPLTLRYRFGIDALSNEDVANTETISGVSPTTRDRDRFDVTKITTQCTQPPPDSPVPAAPANPLEQQLADLGKAEVYDIYFSFGSAELRPESDASLAEIDDLLTKHPDWTLTIAGHTDNVGTAQFNLQLSEDRAAAVKAALVSRFAVAPARLTTLGYGATQPQDSNDTIEGRARNRRVELTRN